jgi:futalosine hydrolase
VKTGHIGIIASVFSEGTLFGSKFKSFGKARQGHPLFYSGTVSDNQVILGISGIGKTNAAHAATILLEKFSPSCIVNFGIGGAYPSSGLRIGDIAVAEKEVYADEGVLLKDGLHLLETTGIPLLKVRSRKYFNEFPADKRLLRLALKAAASVAHSKSGVFLTVSACTGTKKRAKELEGRFSPLCENMEGAAIAHICRIYGIPFVEIRGISNIVEDRDKSKWDIKLASENCQKAVLKFLEALSRNS